MLYQGREQYDWATLVTSDKAVVTVARRVPRDARIAELAERQEAAYKKAVADHSGRRSGPAFAA